MNEDEYKYIVGEATENKPAVIRFYGPVTSETTARFNDEFLWLQNYVKPSKILILINSEGGSVVSGMSTFSVIQSCPIEAHCIIEGIAASMGSVIWAAGTKLYMHDYSILMIHNPFVNTEDPQDETTKNMLKAFRGQLETIYQKRFGLKKSKVREIMDGEGNADGTYLSAKDAVEAGILPSKNVIRTSEQVRADIKSKIEGVQGVTSIRDIMAAMVTDETESKLIEKTLAILEQNKQTNQTQQVMNEKELAFDTVCAQLGLAKDTPMASVAPRITELTKAEAALTTVKAELKTAQDDLASAKAELDELKIQFKGKEAEAKNLSDELAEVKDKLKTYQDAEAAAKAEHIQNIVEAAVTAGKIQAEDKAEWISMAEANLPLVEKTLAGLAPRDKVTQEIANDPANVDAAEKSMKTTQEQLDEKVKAVVGEDFKLKSFS